MVEDNLKIDKFDGTNFNHWRWQIRTVLLAKGLWSYVDGQRDPKIKEGPDGRKDEADIEVAQEKRNKAFALLSTSIAHNQIDYVLTCESAREVWNTLHSIHARKSEISRTGLLQQFYSLEYDPSDTMALHIAKIRNLVAELNAVGEKQSDHAIVSKILMTLPERYNAFRTAFQTMNSEQQTMHRLTAMLVEEEATLERQDKSAGGAFAAAKSARSRENKPRENRNQSVVSSSKSTKTYDGRGKGKAKNKNGCYNCGKVGHFARDCYRKSDWTNGHKGGPKEEHDGSSAWITLDDKELMMTGGDEVGWIVDSGATNHMTPMLEWLHDYQPCRSVITVANNEKMEIIGRGTVWMRVVYKGKWTKISLNNVLHVPGLAKSLFSLGAAADRGCEGRTLGNTMILYDGKQPKAIAVRKSRGHYRLISQVIKPKSEALAVQSPKGEQVSKEVMLAHQRLNHLSLSGTRRMVEQGLLPELKLSSKGKLFCEACEYAKATRATFKRKGEKNRYEPGELIHTDVSGKHEKSYGNASWYIVFKDEATSFRKIYFMSHKNEALDKFKLFNKLVKNQFGRSIKYIRSDRGLEYVNQSFKRYLVENGIEEQLTGRYSPEQNGTAERENRTITEFTGAALHAFDLPKKLWSAAADCTVYTLNRSVDKRNDGKTPFERWTGRKPRLDHLRVFGCDAYEQEPAIHRKKWDKKAKKRVFIGYEGEGPNYKLFDPESHKVTTSKNVSFNEDQSTAIGTGLKQQWPVLINEENNVRKSVEPSEEPEMEDDGPSIALEPMEAQEESEERPKRQLRNRQTIRKPDRYRNEVIESAYFMGIDDEPISFEEATKSDDSEEWQQAIQEELTAHDKNNTWQVVDRPENNVKILKTRWVFKIKRSVDGNVKRYKGRLVIKGFMQREGIDYGEIYAPVVRYESIRVFLSIVAEEDLELGQFDIKTAFLHGDLDEELYIEMPEGLSGSSGSVCRLRKAIYGLKQAPRQWNKKFNNFLKKFKLKPSDADPCIYRGEIENERVLLCLYVDDGLVASRSQKVVDMILESLHDKFEVTISDASMFVGMQIKRNRTNRTLKIHQEKYINKILDRFRYNQTKGKAIPAQPKAQLSKKMAPKSDKEKQEMERVPYRQAIGSLMFAASVTRPDIAYAVGVASRYVENPGNQHWTAVKQILAYLKKTSTLGIIYGRTESEGRTGLIGYTDADYAMCPDTCRSTSGVIFIRNHGAVLWKSRKQPVTAQSTTEAELIAANLGAREAVWLTRLLNDMGEDQKSVLLRVDNQGAIRLAQISELGGRSKHIRVRYYYIRELVENKELEIDYIDTKDQLADMMTKGLPRPAFEDMRSRIGMVADHERVGVLA